MQLMGENVTEAYVDHLLSETDTDRDGKISYEEFLSIYGI